ncbi:hypothetical protein SDC9_99957 [bioreactor metagenome]|uniref:Uncharacterized protein n=1 Tax=bioreactor metagenome TaxID=1076179 RepID=A0A645AIY7_9ZZZZ
MRDEVQCLVALLLRAAHVGQVHQRDQPARVGVGRKRFAQHQEVLALVVAAFLLAGCFGPAQRIERQQRLARIGLGEVGEQLGQRMPGGVVRGVFDHARGGRVGQRDDAQAVAHKGGRRQLVQTVAHEMVQFAQLLRGLLDGMDAPLQKVAGQHAVGARRDRVGQLHAILHQVVHFLAQEHGGGREPTPAPQRIAQQHAQHARGGRELPAGGQCRDRSDEQHEHEHQAAGHESRKRPEQQHCDQGCGHGQQVEDQVPRQRRGHDAKAFETGIEHMRHQLDARDAISRAAHGRRKHVAQACGRGSYQHKFATERVGWHAVHQHVDVGVGGERWPRL